MPKQPNPSPTRVQYSVPYSVPKERRHTPQHNADSLTRPPVDSWYIRTSARVEYSRDKPRQVDMRSQNYAQPDPNMGQPQSPRCHTSRNDTPVSNHSQNAVRPPPNSSQSQSPRVYASAHHTTPQHASTPNGHAHASHAYSQVIIPAGLGHQGVGYQQAESVGLGLSHVPLSPYQTWTTEPIQQTGYSQLPSPAQQHTLYYAPAQNASPHMTPHSQHQHQIMLTDIPQNYINPDGRNGPQNWSTYPHTPHTNGRPSASPHLNQAIPNGYYSNGSPSIPSHPQHHVPHMTGERIPSPLLYPPPASPPKRPNSSSNYRPSSLRNSPRNMYPDPQPLSPTPSLPNDAAARGPSQDKLANDTARKALQDRLREQREHELAVVAKYQEQQRQEQERIRKELERLEAYDRVVEAQKQECINGGLKSCTALMKDACFFCIMRQCERN